MEKIKIGTINLDWCKKSTENLLRIKDVINAQKFDFLIVTENIESFKFNDSHYCAYHSSPLPIHEEYEYMNYGEYLKGKTPIRVSIYTPYNAIGKHEVIDSKTSVAYSFRIKGFDFILYGSIIGTYGLKHQAELAQKELDNFKSDIEHLKKINNNIIIGGDLNTSFISSEKHTQLAQINSRAELKQFALYQKLHIPTGIITENIDHFIVSDSIANEYEIRTEEFIDSDTLKDKYHKGILIEMTRRM